MKFPELKPIDTSELDEAVASLAKSIETLKSGRQLDSFDSSTMEERFEYYCEFIRKDFERGFEDGYLTAYYDNKDSSDAYHEGFRDGYQWSQMLDNATSIQGE